jgi:hypothetical protein
MRQFFVGFFVLWFFGFLLTLVMHRLYSQMVTFPLAILRSLLWPVYIFTGWPYGTPLTMD